MPLTEYDNMVKTFASDRANQPFRVPILPWRALACRQAIRMRRRQLGFHSGDECRRSLALSLDLQKQGDKLALAVGVGAIASPLTVRSWQASKSPAATKSNVPTREESTR